MIDLGPVCVLSAVLAVMRAVRGKGDGGLFPSLSEPIRSSSVGVLSFELLPVELPSIELLLPELRFVAWFSIGERGERGLLRPAPATCFQENSALPVSLAELPPPLAASFLTFPSPRPGTAILSVEEARGEPGLPPGHNNRVGASMEQTGFV